MSSVTFSGSISAGAKNIFLNCKSLISVILPLNDNNKSIDLSSAFNGCTLLSTITNLDKFNKIMSLSSTFKDCPALTNITLPEGSSLKNISFNQTFSGCTALTTINNLEKFPNISSLNYAFNGCTALTSITLPQGTSDETITFNFAFSGCTSLITINNLEKFTNISNFSSKIGRALRRERVYVLG